MTKGHYQSLTKRDQGVVTLVTAIPIAKMIFVNSCVAPTWYAAILAME